MHYPIDTISTILQPEVLNFKVQPACIQHLLFDSRKIIFPKDSLFFALKGLRQDGHDFIGEAYQKGVRNFVVSKPIATEKFPDANFLKVAQPLRALQQLAAQHRQQFQFPVIGITGSNGKTIVKEWLFQLLRENFRIVRSPRSYNSQIGVALSAWQMQEQHNLAIFEAGVSRMEEMQHLATIIQPTIGVFTNIGSAHQEGFPSLEAKIRQKALLFEAAETLIYCKDHEAIATVLQELYPEKRHFCWSAHTTATIQINSIQQEAQRTTVTLTTDNQTYTFSIPFADAAAVENAIHCWCVCKLLNFRPDWVAQRMQHLEPVAMRLEVREGINRCTLINDSYNSDLNALTIALNFLVQQGKSPKRTVILSDILETGEQKENLYQQVANLLQEHQVNRFIGIGEAVQEVQNWLPDRVEQRFFNSTADFLQTMHHADFQQETILLKGARRFQFERIATLLSQKVHQTVLEVDLDALAYNLNVFNRFLKPETKVIIMVKAAAYGSGSAEVAKLLEYKNVDYLAVAYADEGVELRESGIQLPIFVLNPEEATFDTLLRYRLEPEIYNQSLLQNFAAYTAGASEIFPIHLKLDTGMHRLGFSEPDIPSLLHSLQQHPQLQVRSVFSHLAASEAPEHDDFTKEQVTVFQHLYEQIAQTLEYRPLRHILNSSGIIRFPQYQMDIVRLGIGLYGIDSSNLIQADLKTVLTLKATISQIKHLNPGETVGYGRSGKVNTPMRTATISIGYADGLLRRASQGRYSVLIHGKKAPIFGNVCMDMSMVDVTHIPEASEGDEVIVFGEQLPITELAECLGTIPYEVFTGISHRVKRTYIQG